MPLPSRWGVSRRGINISAPDWIYEAVDAYRKEKDYRSVGEAGLELIVARLLEEGVEPPEELGIAAQPARKRARR